MEHLIKSYRKDELQANFKNHPVDITKKIKEIIKQSSAENRYKVVSYFRSLDDSKDCENSEDKIITLIDVEDSKSITKEDSVEKVNNIFQIFFSQFN